MRKIILASSSQYRSRLLARLNFPFETISPSIDESSISNESAEQMVERLAKSKAKKIAENNSDALIIGSDQVAVFERQIIGKPGNHLNASKQLAEFSSKTVRFITGVALLDSKSFEEFYQQSTVTVTFKQMSSFEIENYLLIDKPYDCAGSFKVESLGISLFESVQSDDPTSLEGLPLITVCQLLSKAGFN